MKSATKKQAEHLRQMALAAMEKADLLDKVPDESIFEDGDVIKFKRRFEPEGKAYIYVAVKIADIDRWAVSAVNVKAHYMTWEQIANFVVDGQIEKMWVCAKWNKVALP